MHNVNRLAFEIVIAGLDPAIRSPHRAEEGCTDARVEPGHDEVMPETPSRL
jgi:hypothetical protein